MVNYSPILYSSTNQTEIKMNTITIKYNGTVLTPAGFRSVEMTARAEQITPKL